MNWPDSPALQLFSERSRHCKSSHCRSMEAPHDGPYPIGRNSRAHRDIIRKPGVEARRERPAALQAPAAHRPADRPFGGDMNRIRLRRIQHCADFAATAEREPDFGVGGTSHGTKRAWFDNLDLMSNIAKPCNCGRQRTNHPVDLGMPGIGRNGDLQANVSAGAVGDSLLALSASSRLCAAQSMISIRPSACSTSAVQLSTQSPSL